MTEPILSTGRNTGTTGPPLGVEESGGLPYQSERPQSEYPSTFPHTDPCGTDGPYAKRSTHIEALRSGEATGA